MEQISHVVEKEVAQRLNEQSDMDIVKYHKLRAAKLNFKKLEQLETGGLFRPGGCRGFRRKEWAVFFTHNPRLLKKAPGNDASVCFLLRVLQGLKGPRDSLDQKGLR